MEKGQTRNRLLPIEVERHFYSVPHALVGQVLDVRMTAGLIEVLHKGQRVASHPRQETSGFSTLPEHMPQRHRRHRDWSPGRFLNWAKDIGPCTVQVVNHQLHNRPHPEHGYRACLGLLSHARRYGKARLEAACDRALAIDSPTYRSIRSILKRGLDRLHHGETEGEDNRTLPQHANLRGSDYYH